MKLRLLFPALLLLGTAAMAAAAELPVDRVSLPVPRDKTVRVDFPVGTLRVEPTDAGKVSFDLTVKCKGRSQADCEERADQIRIESDEAGGVLSLKVKGYPKYRSHNIELRGVLRVPAELALRIEMGVGDLRITDIQGDLDVDLGVGDADIHTSERAVRSVEVSTGVGDAAVFASGGRVRRHSFISSSASWDEGRGKSNVNLNVGVGDGTVRVD